MFNPESFQLEARIFKKLFMMLASFIGLLLRPGILLIISLMGLAL